MNKIYFLFIFLISTFSFTACQEKDGMPETCLGECSYYPSFLWSDADTSGVTKHLVMDFNADAKGDNETFAEIAFVDKDSNPIPDDILEITIGDEILKGNIFIVHSSDKEKDIKFRFLPKAESGNHQGFLKLITYKLDRFEDQELTGSPIEVMKWNLYFDKRMNPLAKCFMWVVSALLIFLFVWFVIFQRFFYPKFGSIQKTFNVPGMAPLIVKFKGARMVIVSASDQKKQSIWNRFWTGKIIYKTHPAFVSPITFKPRKGHKVLAKVQGGAYQVMPNPMSGIGASTIIDIKKNLKINVN